MNIEHLQKSNDPPSSSEGHARIAECNLDIAAVATEMGKLERKWRQIEEKGKTHVGVLSKFPSELIGEIFRNMVTPNAESDSSRQLATASDLTQLAALGRVSRRWNQILYSIPLLCTGLSLCVSRGEHMDDLVPRLQWWMKLAHHTSLSLLVSHTEEKFTNSSRFMSIILDNRKVWRELHLPIPRADGCMLCDPASENQWDALEALSLGDHLGLHEGNDLLRNGERPIHLGQFPRLKSLFLAYCEDVVLPHQFSFPWSNLTDLILDLENTVEQYICIIQLCPDLESLHLGFLDPMEPITPLPSMVLSNLRRLSIGDMSVCRLLLPSIQCPVLTSLEIDTLDDPFDEHDTNALHAFFSKTTTLTKLKLSVDIPLDDDDLVYLLKATPSLADLCIRADGAKGAFLSQLKDGHLTKLHTLEIEGAPDECSRRKFVDFICSRRTESTTYTRLEHAVFLSQLKDGHLTKLHTLEIEGAPDECSRRKFVDFICSCTESTTYTRLDHAVSYTFF